MMRSGLLPKILLLAGLMQPLVADAAASLYRYQQGNGTPVYSDRKPAHRGYVQIQSNGRPTATASCFGLTARMLEQRADQFQPLIAKHAATHGVPAALVRAVMRVESCFDRKAISRAGARGLMQLMPATASELGVHDSFDADQNIGGGVRYLKAMLQRFNQNTSLALAAYNAGPESVQKHGGIPPYAETRSYVKRVLANYRARPAESAKASLKPGEAHAQPAATPH